MIILFTDIYDNLGFLFYRKGEVTTYDEFYDPGVDYEYINWYQK